MSAEQKEAAMSEALFCRPLSVISTGCQGLYCDHRGHSLIPSKSYQTTNRAFGIFSGAASHCCQAFSVAMSDSCWRERALFIFTIRYDSRMALCT